MIKYNTVIATGTSSKANSRWEAQKSKLKKQFPVLTDADLNYDETEKVTMFEVLGIKLSVPVKKLQLIIETL